MHDLYWYHVILGYAALFVGAAQFTIRWMWGTYLRSEDKLSIRLWAISTMLTALVICYVMLKFKYAPVDQYYYLVLAVVVGKATSTAASVRSLRTWMREPSDVHHMLP